MDKGLNCCSTLYELPLTELLLGNSFHPGGLTVTRQLAESALVGRSSRVLDVACGVGSTARFLAEEFAATVIGTDRSQSLLDEAQARTQQAGLQDRVQFKQSDVTVLAFPDNYFDVVFCECALCLFADAAAALSEFLRVLKPGGRLAISDVVVNKLIPTELIDPLGHALCISGARSADAYKNLITQAGFVTLRFKDVSTVLLDMVGRIEKRLHFADVLVELNKFGLAGSVGDSQQILQAARDFIVSQGAGYALFVARKPRSGSSA